jgi:hypothetical protein
VPAPAKYPYIPDQLRESAVKAKALGLSFEEWWELARRPGKKPLTVQHGGDPGLAVLWPTDTVDRRLWLGAVDGSKDGWQAAYEGSPAERRHEALDRLREHLRHAASFEDMGEGNDHAAAVA